MGTSTRLVRLRLGGGVLHWHVVLHSALFAGKCFSRGDGACPECDDLFQKITSARHNSSQCSVVQVWMGTGPSRIESTSACEKCASVPLSCQGRGRGGIGASRF